MVWLLAALVLVCLAGFTWWFLHRDPDIVIRRTRGFLCPADGEVVDIISVEGRTKKIPKKNHGITAFLDDAPWARKIVVIMMKPQHIHTQRSPVDGTVTRVVHKSGSLRNAVDKDYRRATAENEHVAITISGEKPCKVYLIAGFAARRIKPAVRKGQRVKQGERIGSIAFGSQVAVVLPDCNIIVKEGERALVARTVIAR